MITTRRVLAAAILFGAVTASRADDPPAAPDRQPTPAVVRAERNEATIAVLKEQVDRLREDVRGAVGHLQAIQARFDALNQTYVPRVEAEQARKLDATPERVASLSARMDALEARVNSYGDRLVGYALVGGLGLAGGAGVYHTLKSRGNPAPQPTALGMADDKWDRAFREGRVNVAPGDPAPALPPTAYRAPPHAGPFGSQASPGPNPLGGK